MGLDGTGGSILGSCAISIGLEAYPRPPPPATRTSPGARPDGTMHHARHHDSAWLCQCLQPSRDIHPIAVDVALFDDHVTQVYPDAKSEPPILRLPDVIPCYLRLTNGSATSAAMGTAMMSHYAT